MDNRRGLILAIIAVIILASGVGYYLWNKKEASVSDPGGITITEPLEPSFLDNFLGRFLSDEERSSNFKEYKDAAGTFSIKYPSSWVVRSGQGRLLTGAIFTPADLLAKYSSEEQQFVRGLVVGAGETNETPENYFKKITAEVASGQTEAANLTINGYPAYHVKGNINGTYYVVYVLTHNNHVVYFNYRTEEDVSAHQNDIRKAIDFGPYVTDFEDAVNSIKFLK